MYISVCGTLLYFIACSHFFGLGDPSEDFERTWERCHQDLYEDAFARQQRLRDMQHYMKQMEEDDQKTRLQQCQDGMKRPGN